MCRSLGVWVCLFLIKLIEASEQNMSQTADKHTKKPEKTSQIWCVSHRKALISLFPHLQDCLLLFLLIGNHISMIKTEKLPGGPRGSTLLMHSCSASDSEEEEKPASPQEDRTKDSQRINKVWKELQSGGVWNRRPPKRPGGWVGGERRPPDWSPAEREEEGGRDAAESAMAAPRQKQQPVWQIHCNETTTGLIHCGVDYRFQAAGWTEELIPQPEMFKCLHHAQNGARKQENTVFAVGFVEEVKSAEFIFDW